MQDPNSETRVITRYDHAKATRTDDSVTIEEPLEIRLAYGKAQQRSQQSISITMRTPGHDEELATGFLLSEGIIHGPGDVKSVAPCGPPVPPMGLRNVVRVELHESVSVDLARLERHFYTTSSCGVCGKTSLEALQTQKPKSDDADVLRVIPQQLTTLSDQLGALQTIFARTGGLHAAGLFDNQALISCVREDVGRHNAVDKLIGAQMRDGVFPLTNHGIFVSGRASFELMQKTVMSGANMLVAVSAPSSLAIELAESYNVTLIGFLRDRTFNIYSAPHRVRES